MKKLILTAAAILLICAAFANAQCPADKAEAEGGKTPFSAFHKFMAPAWHVAYGAKDYDAMIKAADGFDSTFKEVAAIEPKMKNVLRKAEFLANREKFAAELKKYCAFAKAGEKDSVYATLPQLHEYFEMTAMAFMPIEYAELTSMIVTTNLLVTKHVPAKNWEGITGSTETLVNKAAALKPDNFPSELASQKEAMMKEFVLIQKSVEEIKAAC
ncbi:MAG: hypothetical protein WAU88_11395, partial [Candidatus Zixiibacteriota bacterium]